MKYSEEPFPSIFEKSESLFNFLSEEYKKGDSDVPLSAKPNASIKSPIANVAKLGAIK